MKPLTMLTDFDLLSKRICFLISLENSFSAFHVLRLFLGSLLFLSSGDWIQIEILAQTGLVFISLRVYFVFVPFVELNCCGYQQLSFHFLSVLARASAS